MKPTLGTQLRHLIELLDGAVQDAYIEAGVETRPRYTPVFRALAASEPCTLGQIASAAGITQPAATQTISLMIKDGLVSAKPAPDDARQRLIRLTKKGRALYPKMQACWAATNLAANSLDQETALSAALASAIAALEAKPFAQRIADARIELAKGQLKMNKISKIAIAGSAVAILCFGAMFSGLVPNPAATAAAWTDAARHGARCGAAPASARSGH